jgi:hypothetical protein
MNHEDESNNDSSVMPSTPDSAQHGSQQRYQLNEHQHPFIQQHQQQEVPTPPVLLPTLHDPQINIEKITDSSSIHPPLPPLTSGSDRGVFYQQQQHPVEHFMHQHHQQEDYQQQKVPTATAPSVLPTLHVPQISTSNINGNTDSSNPPSMLPLSLNLPQQQNLIRTVTNMFRQQAQLCNQQANILEHISRNIHDRKKWFPNVDVDDQISVNDNDDNDANDSDDDDDGDNNDKDASDRRNGQQHGNKNDIRMASEKDAFIQKRLEREAVVRLATKSYQGMKELQKTMEAFLNRQQQRPRHGDDSSSSSSDGDMDIGTDMNVGMDAREHTASNQRHQRGADEQSSSILDHDAIQSFVAMSANMSTANPIAAVNARASMGIKRERDEESSNSDASSSSSSEYDNKGPSKAARNTTLLNRERDE